MICITTIKRTSHNLLKTHHFKKNIVGKSSIDILIFQFSRVKRRAEIKPVH